MKRRIYKICGVLISLLLGSIIIIEGLIINEGHNTYTNEVDYIIVLGARLYGEQPSPSLRERLRVAHTYLEEHDRVKVVVSGGQGHNEDVSEAYAMKKYLIDRGIEEDRIIMEDRSTNTFENLSFSKELIMQDNKDKDFEILIATNSYHIYRARMIASRLDMVSYGLPAPVPESTRLKSYAREYLALIKSLVFDR